VKAPKIRSCAVFGVWNSASHNIQNCTVSTDVATRKLRNLSSIHCEFWIVVTDFDCFEEYLKFDIIVSAGLCLKLGEFPAIGLPCWGVKIWFF